MFNKIVNVTEALIQQICHRLLHADQATVTLNFSRGWILSSNHTTPSRFIALIVELIVRINQLNSNQIRIFKVLYNHTIQTMFRMRLSLVYSIKWLRLLLLALQDSLVTKHNRWSDILGLSQCWGHSKVPVLVMGKSQKRICFCNEDP